MRRLIDADRLKREFPKNSDWEYPVNTNEHVCEVIDAQPEVQLSPIEQALHGLSPEEQADYLEKLMRETWYYTDSRAALIRWLEKGKWNGQTD